MRKKLISILGILMICGCSGADKFMNEVNETMDKRAKDKVKKEFQKKYIATIRFDELEVYYNMSKSEALSRANAGIHLIKNSSSNERFEIYRVMMDDGNEQIELGELYFLDNSLLRAEKIHKFYDENDSIKAITYFFDVIERINKEAGEETKRTIVRKKYLDIEDKMSIFFGPKEISLHTTKQRGKVSIIIKESLSPFHAE